ncbi:hypothetical protein lerEdw1_007698, partial [Lerista edwardsae]
KSCDTLNSYICKIKMIRDHSRRKSPNNKTQEVQPPFDGQLGNETSVQTNLGNLPTSHPIWRADTCPREWLKYQGNCYGLFHRNVSWHEAEIECQSYGPGTHLASILTGPETLIVARYLSTYKHKGVDVWIGLHDTHHNGNWRWTDESPYNHKNWRRGEPNILRNSKYCVALRARTGYGRWINAVCEKAKAYICKHDLSEKTEL